MSKTNCPRCGGSGEVVLGHNSETGDTRIGPCPQCTLRVLSIDAWRDPEGGWFWNNWHHIGHVPAEPVDMPPRRLLRAMREHGFLNNYSKGRLAVEDDGYNVVILRKSDGMPVFAIEYGSQE